MCFRITILGLLLLISCKQSDSNLVVVENDYEIDVTKVDLVRANLNGFWVNANQLKNEEVLYLQFDSVKNFTFWRTLPFTTEVLETQIIPISSSLTITELAQFKDTVHLIFTSMSDSDTSKIEYLSKTKFKIDGTSYLRHRGYPFWN